MFDATYYIGATPQPVIPTSGHMGSAALHFLQPQGITIGQGMSAGLFPSTFLKTKFRLRDGSVYGLVAALGRWAWAHIRGLAGRKARNKSPG